MILEGLKLIYVNVSLGKLLCHAVQFILQIDIIIFYDKS
jgi:hypothetical protein